MHSDQEVTQQEAQLVVDTAYSVPFIDVDLSKWVDRAAWDRATITYIEIEQRLIEGEDRIEVTQPGGGTLTYEVPRWSEQPIRRARVAWRRWRFRRKTSNS
jgi:hypothetical protein